MTSPYKHAAAPLKKPKKLSPGEELLALHIRAAKLGPPQREFKFHPERKWAFDFYFASRRLGVEVDGGNTLAVIGSDGRPRAVGRHTQADDYRKLNEAALLGYTVLRFTPAQVKNGEALSTIERALKLRASGEAEKPFCQHRQNGRAGIY